MRAKDGKVRGVDHQKVAVRRDGCPWRKGQVHARGEIHAVQIQRQAAAAIAQFDELELASARRLIHHFCQPQIVHQCRGIVRQADHKLNRLRPVAPAAGVVLHQHAHAVSVADFGRL